MLTIEIMEFYNSTNLEVREKDAGPCYFQLYDGG